MRVSAFDSHTKSGPVPEHVILPHKLIQAPRPHPYRQGRISRGNRSGVASVACIEQSISHYG
jgi:hypothetical protein